MNREQEPLNSLAGYKARLSIYWEQEAIVVVRRKPLIVCRTQAELD